MLRLLTGTLQGVSPARLARIAQDLADAMIGDHAVLHVLIEQPARPDRGQRRVVLTLNRPATPNLLGRYELEPKVWLRIDRCGAPVVLPATTDWRAFQRDAPVPRRPAARGAP